MSRGRYRYQLSVEQSSGQRSQRGEVAASGVQKLPPATVQLRAAGSGHQQQRKYAAADPGMTQHILQHTGVVPLDIYRSPT